MSLLWCMRHSYCRIHSNIYRRLALLCCWVSAIVYWLACCGMSTETGLKPTRVDVGYNMSTSTAHCRGGDQMARGLAIRRGQTNEVANNHNTGCVLRLAKRMLFFTVRVSCMVVFINQTITCVLEFLLVWKTRVERQNVGIGRPAFYECRQVLWISKPFQNVL